MKKAVGIDEFVCSTMAVACRREPGDVTLETQLFDLDMDSLTLVAVLTQVEAVYDIQLTPADMLKFIEAARVGEIVSGLEQLLRTSVVGHSSRPASDD
jgi:acyl carrier protein